MFSLSMTSAATEAAYLYLWRPSPPMAKAFALLSAHPCVDLGQTPGASLHRHGGGVLLSMTSAASMASAAAGVVCGAVTGMTSTAAA